MIKGGLCYPDTARTAALTTEAGVCLRPQVPAKDSAQFGEICSV
jgi:hypothetical protein